MNLNKLRDKAYQRAGRRAATEWYPGRDRRRVPGCVPLCNIEQYRRCFLYLPAV